MRSNKVVVWWSVARGSRARKLPQVRLSDGDEKSLSLDANQRQLAGLATARKPREHWRAPLPLASLDLRSLAIKGGSGRGRGEQPRGQQTDADK